MSASENRDFLVPDLGEGLEDATVSSWSVTVGDEVELNQTLCTLETAKAEVEIPSPYAGRVTELGGAVGDVLPVGARAGAHRHGNRRRRSEIQWRGTKPRSRRIWHRCGGRQQPSGGARNEPG